MALEFETEVRIEEDFSTWSNEAKLNLIIHIITGHSWTFEGTDTVSYEPDKLP